MAEEYNELNHDEECWLPKAKDISVWHFDKWKVDKPEDVYSLKTSLASTKRSLLSP